MNNATDAQGLVREFIAFINTTLVPLVFALAFLLFLFGVFKYFFGSGKGADENRQEGKKFIMWGVIALAVMISVWGLVNILVRTFGFGDDARPCLPTFSGPCDNSSGGSTRQPTNLLPNNPADEPGLGDGTGLPAVY